MFTWSEHRSEFIVYAKNILKGRNTVLFTFLVADVILLIFAIPKVFLYFIFYTDKISEKLKQRIQLLFILISFWMMVWVIPRFVFSFFELSQSLIYLFSFLIGIFATGFVCFYTTLLVVKGVLRYRKLYRQQTDEIMENINKKYDFLISLKSGIISSKKSTDSLVTIEQYLVSNLNNPDLAFSEKEYNFLNCVYYYISYHIGFVDKNFPFLTSYSRKQNINLLKKIYVLFERKIALLKSLYEKDVLIVEEYLIYAKKMMKTGEMYFYKNEYENILWAKNEFPENMYNYLSYQIRINPKSLTDSYIQTLQGHYSLCALGLDDEVKVIRLNQYLSKAVDPFSLDIPSEYEDIRTEIRMLLYLVLANERIFLKIVADVKQKYI